MIVLKADFNSCWSRDFVTEVEYLARTWGFGSEQTFGDASCGISAGLGISGGKVGSCKDG